jgi:hypothetical protein
MGILAIVALSSIPGSDNFDIRVQDIPYAPGLQDCTLDVRERQGCNSERKAMCIDIKQARMWL